MAKQWSVVCALVSVLTLCSVRTIVRSVLVFNVQAVKKVQSVHCSVSNGERGDHCLVSILMTLYSSEVHLCEASSGRSICSGCV